MLIEWKYSVANGASGIVIAERLEDAAYAAITAIADSDCALQLLGEVGQSQGEYRYESKSQVFILFVAKKAA